MTTYEVNDNPHCFVCTNLVYVGTRNSFQIFHKQVQTGSQRPISSIISSVLGIELTENNVHSKIICLKCFKLFNEIDDHELRISQIKNDIIKKYKRSYSMYRQNGNIVILECEGTRQENESNSTEETASKKNSDNQSLDGQPTTEVMEEDIETQLARLHKEEDSSKQKTDSDEEIIEIHLESADGESYQNFEIETEETIDGDNMNSDESEYEHIEELEENSGDDNTTALLEAAALSEQNISEDGQLVKIKVEPDIDESITKYERRNNHSKNKIKSKIIKEEYVEPLVERNGNKYTCLVCEGDTKFTSEGKQMMLHVKNVHDLRVYICDVCGDDFRKRNELSAHLDIHVATEEGDFQCEVCNRIFCNLRLFRIHKRMHYPQSKLWTCETCGKRYSSRNLLEEHINTHTGLRPYVCKVCNKDFASKYTYKAHEKTHEVRPRPFQCQTCLKTFLTQQNLNQHERVHSDIKEYVCHLCGKAFVSPHNLEVHSIVHTGYKPYICGICGKAFARKAEIRDHERTHTGERPYQCEFCGATFSQRSNLQSHKRATHYDDKRYKCQTCGKGFKRRRLLDYHMKAAHTGERPFKCNICEATFVYPEHFKKHRRIHTGEKPFLCEVCGKAFNSRDNRNAHRFVHSDKKPYECLVCGMGFMRKPLLYSHMQTQGHLNDTIVVNQPRVTTDDDHIITVNAEGQVITVNADGELVDSEGKRLQQIVSDADDGDASEDTKLYIAELKEHVIIQDSGYTNSKGTMILGNTLDGDTDQAVQDAVKHLIIDGQEVQFAEQDADGEVLTPQILNANGEFEVVAEGFDEEDTQTIETPNGPVQLVRIRIPSADGGEEDAWVKIVPD